MKPLRVAIVDDEEPARAALRVLLSRRHDLEVVAECRNGEEAVEVLGWLTVDLLLLDVQMPGFDGFQVVQAIGAERMPPTIFVTAYDTYALRAFDVQAIDYVLANSPMREGHVTAEIDRYAVTPGQALAYMIGRLEIQKIRREAEAALGDRFRIKEFHDTVLGAGPMPLPILARRVGEWVSDAAQATPA